MNYLKGVQILAKSFPKIIPEKYFFYKNNMVIVGSSRSKGSYKEEMDPFFFIDFKNRAAYKKFPADDIENFLKCMEKSKNF